MTAKIEEQVQRQQSSGRGLLERYRAIIAIWLNSWSVTSMTT